MFGKSSRTARARSGVDVAQVFMSVIDRTQATIQFTPDGEILTANENFLSVMGFELSELVGRHHSMFVRPDQARSPGYRAFWDDLAAGKSFTDQFPRVAKDGTTVWISATYAPYIDADGTVTRVVKIATDVSARRRGIERIAAALHALSEGDLAQELDPCGVADLDRLGTAFNTAIGHFSQAITAAKHVAAAVETTAGEVGEASTDLSRRTESQAATLEETAAAIRDLTATARETAEGARDVETSANAARVTAEHGGSVVENAVRAMSKIEQSSNQISQIIGVIDDIAFQTNLLALNAGVEAARAGNAGRGFAVVASEIRLLAQRSAEAADEIKQLITQSSGDVSSGVGLVHQAGDELGKIVSGVARIYAHVEKITQGASDQVASLSEINSAVGQLDTVTQQNAAMVEQSTAVSQVLARDARDLSHQMAMFRTGQPVVAPGDPTARENTQSLRAISRNR
ncbi:MAG: methyl-accepting chemotaxis protein [Roseovarius sp.]